MFVVIKSGGKQYRVRKDQELLVERLPGEVGDVVELPVSLAGGEGSYEFGGTAKAEIVEHLKGEKLHVYKYKPKKGYRKKTGHRQSLTKIRITEV